MAGRRVAGQAHLEDDGLKSSFLAARIASTFDVACQSCRATMVRAEVWFPGMPILAEYHCGNCGAAFLVDWPAGHALLHPTMLRTDTGDIYFDGSEWYPRALQRLLASRSTPLAAPIEVRRSPPQHRTAVVVNSVDYVYGHCVLKLLSVGRQVSEPDVDVVLIVQKELAWLVPSGVHAVIELELPLAGGDRWIAGLDAAVKAVLQDYETVRIAPTPSQPRLTTSDLAEALPGEPFPLWDAEPAPAQVTLLLREDRPWIGSSKWVDRLRPGRVLPVSLRRRLTTMIQNRRFATVVRQVQAVLPETQFVVIGQGCSGRVRAAVTDLRRTAITIADERRWVHEYARTAVAVGVHGSHMLLPSALAGAVVDLLPQAKLPNVTQDLLIPADRGDPKLLLFRHRIIPERSTPDTVSEIIVSILSDKGFHHRNVIDNQAADGRDWPRPPHWQRLEPARR